MCQHWDGCFRYNHRVCHADSLLCSHVFILKVCRCCVCWWTRGHHVFQGSGPGNVRLCSSLKCVMCVRCCRREHICFWAQVVVVFANAHSESIYIYISCVRCCRREHIVFLGSSSGGVRQCPIRKCVYVVFAVADVNITCAHTHFPEVFNCIHRDTQLVVDNSAPAHLQLICRSVDNVKLYVALLQLQMVMQLTGVGCCH